MSHERPSETSAPAGLEVLISELHIKSRAREFDISREEFGSILNQIAVKYCPEAPTGVRELYLTLHVEELVLARACAAGHEKAWEHFLVRYREKLYEVAGYIAKEAAAARELADSLYADLYGTQAREGKRVSKLASYTGRGSLEGWLRTVLAQEYVNQYRRQRRLVSLEEESEEGTQYAAPQKEAVPGIDPRLERATDQAFAALDSQDRFVLASYYLDGRTLAEISRQLRVHESTISRKLDKIAKSLRKNIITGLRKAGMSSRQVEEALQVDVRDLSINIRNRMAQESDRKSFPGEKAEAPAGDRSR
ncbi:MAG TPA: sigma-70 family RNA polymerase sigma factor [Terriglobales bacterium]|nr:sigma-70 family RNA polymerase sigma factor [Terriglobales bacterium]